VKCLYAQAAGVSDQISTPSVMRVLLRVGTPALPVPFPSGPSRPQASHSCPAPLLRPQAFLPLSCPAPLSRPQVSLSCPALLPRPHVPRVTLPQSPPSCARMPLRSHAIPPSYVRALMSWALVCARNSSPNSGGKAGRQSAARSRRLRRTLNERQGQDS
jgi:hypothetical protein